MNNLSQKTPMKMATQSGQNGFRVLVSDGAEQFDPNSLMDETHQQPSTPNSPLALVILTVVPPDGLDKLQIGGIFKHLSIDNSFLTLNMTVLVPLAIKLSQLVLMNDATCLESIEIPTVEQAILEPRVFLLNSVQFDSPLNNLVNMTVLFKSYEHHRNTDGLLQVHG